VARQSQEFITTMLETPIHTFVGRGASAVNDQLLRAEALLETGRFFDAADRYETAHMLDPANPLPLIGKGHALLAAGEYLSAAVYLIRGLERFPELSRFRVNLEALIGGGEIIDIRRADIMARLKRLEDPRLRFLLGYIEVHTGMRESGLENLDRAARQAKPGSLIARYPAMLRGEGPLPPPKLPLDIQTELDAQPREAAPEVDRPPSSSEPLKREDPQ
jgi:tetratricopeptide (TPR) repeat protein